MFSQRRGIANPFSFFWSAASNSTADHLRLQHVSSYRDSELLHWFDKIWVPKY